MEAKKSKIFIDCEEAKHICDKSQYKESSIWERFRLSIRLIYCKITRKYVKRNQKLTKLVKSKDVECMDSHHKRHIKEVISKELNNS